METWKSVAGYEELYEVSDEGNVRSLQSGRWHNRQKILEPGKNRGGYLYVVLCKDGQHKTMKVHRLVAEAFIPNPNHLATVNHKDENKHNNSANNLEWMTVADNNIYSKARPVQQFDKSTGELLAAFPSLSEAGRITGISPWNICRCCQGKRKVAGGYIWRYI